jgi:predicted GNAT family N-acyltransferase
MMSKYTLGLVDWPEEEAALRHIRQTVFIDEQRVPEELEWDGLDNECVHVLVRNGSDKPIATARMTTDGHIGRMAVLSEHRRQGIGSAMLSLLIDHARKQGLKMVRLNAQVSVRDFYEKQEFHGLGAEFQDAGIPHIRMEREL